MGWPEHDDVVARSFILREGAQVQDLDDFAAHHDKYLVPLYGEGGAAAWHEYVKHSGGYAEGYVSLKSNGRELVDPRLWSSPIGWCICSFD